MINCFNHFGPSAFFMTPSTSGFIAMALAGAALTLYAYIAKINASGDQDHTYYAIVFIICALIFFGVFLACFIYDNYRDLETILSGSVGPGSLKKTFCI